MGCSTPHISGRSTTASSSEIHVVQRGEFPTPARPGRRRAAADRSDAVNDRADRRCSINVPPARRFAIGVVRLRLDPSCSSRSAPARWARSRTDRASRSRRLHHSSNRDSSWRAPYPDARINTTRTGMLSRLGTVRLLANDTERVVVMANTGTTITTPSTFRLEALLEQLSEDSYSRRSRAARLKTRPTRPPSRR